MGGGRGFSAMGEVKNLLQFNIISYDMIFI
jgi:hypothetical protein